MKGKEKCYALKEVRQRIAKQYGLSYYPSECQHDEDCAGNCHQCDVEQQDLLRQLREMGVERAELDRLTEEMTGRCAQDDALPDDTMESEDDATVRETRELLIKTSTPETHASCPQPKRRRRFFNECAVAGWCFHHVDDFWDELYEGQKLVLIRQPYNKHDSNAVAVALADDIDACRGISHSNLVIGYVPRTDNELIANMMDMGWSNVFEAELTTVSSKGASHERLRMTIYIKPKDEKSEYWFAQQVDDSHVDNLTKSLYQNGVAHFYWGGFPLWENDLPGKYDKVVFIHKRKTDAELYLMQTIAIGEDATPLLDDTDELETTDDCALFVLTLVKGPVEVDLDDLNFLSYHTIRTFQPSGKLPDCCIDKLKDMFF